MMDDVLLQMAGVGFSYPKQQPALQEIHIDLPIGSYLMITGPSGAGKTTLLRLMALALRPSVGEVRMMECAPWTLPYPKRAQMRQRIGFVFQDLRLIDHLTIMENVSLPLTLTRRLTKQVTAQVADLLEWVGLGEKLETRPLHLSDGEKQRVALARAVIARPVLLLADEPAGRLGQEYEHRAHQLLHVLHQNGTTIVHATHNTHVLRRHDGPVCSLKAGRMTWHRVA
ncbi:MAG: ATP-binding cassette domain-containing protein [Pseudomonadota bacterium]